MQLICTCISVSLLGGPSLLFKPTSKVFLWYRMEVVPLSTLSFSLWTEVLLFHLASMTHAFHTLTCTYDVMVHSQLVQGAQVLVLTTVACRSPPESIEAANAVIT